MLRTSWPNTAARIVIARSHCTFKRRHRWCLQIAYRTIVTRSSRRGSSSETALTATTEPHRAALGRGWRSRATRYDLRRRDPTFLFCTESESHIGALARVIRRAGVVMDALVLRIRIEMPEAPRSRELVNPEDEALRTRMSGG